MHHAWQCQTAAPATLCLGSSAELIVLCCLTVPFLRCHQWESASRCTLALPQGNLTLSAGETDCEKTIDPQLKYARAENRLRSLNRNAPGLPSCFSDTSPPLKTGKRCAPCCILSGFLLHLFNHQAPSRINPPSDMRLEPQQTPLFLKVGAPKNKAQTPKQGQCSGGNNGS